MWIIDQEDVEREPLHVTLICIDRCESAVDRSKKLLQAMGEVSSLDGVYAVSEVIASFFAFIHTLSQGC